MTAFHVKDQDKAPPPAAGKEGEGYDRCPWDGCIETESAQVIGGQDGKGGGHYDAFIYSADRRKGGCGAPWTRTTKQGVKRDADKGIDSKWESGAAQRDRTVNAPSEAYRRGYDLIDWNK